MRVAIFTGAWDCPLKREASAIHIDISGLHGPLTGLDGDVPRFVTVSAGSGHNGIRRQIAWIVNFSEVLPARAEAVGLLSLSKEGLIGRTHLSEDINEWL